ncbi:MAG: response regulator [Burkholderiaceae bacterium]|jgi:DNA-binding response OmpR family regulator|nr:response regulator [Burkholderiaceae bacterium]
MAERILVVDDEEGIRELLFAYLSGFGFDVAAVADGGEMRRHLAEHRVDLVLLDLGLPQEDGLVLARELRSRDDVPGIIIVTGRGEPVDRILGLELGADDYIPKPFDLRELVARVRSVLRRVRPEGAASAAAAAPEQQQRFEFDGWRIDLAARSVARPDGTPVELTTGEFDLLATFVRQPNRALTRDELMDALYRREAGPFDRAIDVLVGRLRRKIERDPAGPQLVKSVRGVGYLFAARVAPDARSNDASR